MMVVVVIMMTMVVTTMMVMVTTRLDPAHEARISLCMCMTPLGNACMH